MRLGAIQLSAMLAALLLSVGLVVRISATLSPVAPETRSASAAEQAIRLHDGAGGVTLFEGVTLAPGHAAARCVTLRATGTRTPDEVLMDATSRIDPGLAPWLHLDIRQGPALGDGRSCDGFVASQSLISGRADHVMEALDRGLTWAPAATQAVPGGHGVSYQLLATLLPEAPNEIQGTAMGFDLQWSTDFDVAGRGLLNRVLALAIRFTEDSMIPMLSILALAILFLGIQDRLDTATPRLSEAALFDDVVEFRDTAGPDRDGRARDPAGPHDGVGPGGT